MAKSDRRPRAGLIRFALDRLPLIAFCISALLLAFAYGVATMKYEIFPHSFLTRAQDALDALRKVERNQEPPHFIRYLQPNEATRITRAAAAGDDPDLILMTGGFYYRTDLCPKVGCIAWIMSRDGTVRHTWSYDPEKLFAAGDFKDFNGWPGAHNVFVQGADLDPQGNLVVTFQGRNVFPYQVGVAKFDRAGKVLWKRIDHSHHWPTAGPDSRIYVPVARLERPGDRVEGMPRAPKCVVGAIYQDGVRVLAPDGQVLHEFWMSEVVRASGRKALAFTVRDDCDPFHVNGIDLVNAAAARKLQAIGVADARPGDLAVSLRSSSSLVIMDGETGRIKHIAYGAMVDQHSPAALPDGDFLVFDNIGASSGDGRSSNDRSRVLKLGLGKDDAEQVFPRPGGDDPRLFSESEGSVNVSADGKRALVAETLGGRVFEVDLQTGAVLWSYREADDISDYLALAGAKPSDKLALLQTQGAAFVTLADFNRLFAPH